MREKRGKKMDALEMLNRGMNELDALLNEMDELDREIAEGLDRIGKILDELA